MNIPTHYTSNTASKSTTVIVVIMQNFEVIQYLHLHNKLFTKTNYDNNNTNKYVELKMYAIKK
jgi:hypothetical protein